MYKITRKFTLYIILLICINTITGLSVNTTKGSAIEVGEIVVSSNLISVSPQTFVVGNIQNNIISSSEYTTPSGGKIRIDTRPSWINEPQAIYDRNPTLGTDADGVEYKIYHAVIPFEYDINVYTSFTYKDITGIEPTYASAGGSDSKVVIGRGYLGDQLESVWGYQVNGWRRASCSVAQDDVGSIKVVGDKWKTSSSTVPNYKTDKDCLGTVFEHGDDGENLFKNTHATKEWYGNVPYVKTNAPTLTTSEGSINSVDFNAQKDFIISKTRSTSVDIGSFNVYWKIALAPPLGMTPSFDINNDGSVVYNLDGSWVNVKEAITMDDYNRKGLVSGVTAGSISNFIVNPPTDSKVGGSGSSNLNDNKGSQGSGFQTFESSSNPIASTIEPSEADGGDSDYSLGSPQLYSNDKKKLLSDFTSTELKSIANYTSWELRMNGFNCAPRVQVFKKLTNIDYKEQWYDEAGDYKGLRINKNSYFTAIPTLAGWEVYNTFVHQRVRISVDIYSKYRIIVSQTKDREDISTSDDPENPIGNRVWDNSNYNVDNYREGYGTTGLDTSWWDNLWDSLLGDYAWVLWVVIGIVGLVLVYYVYTLIPKQPKQPQYGYGTPPPQYGYQTQAQNIQLQQLQQQNAQLVNLINQLQQQLSGMQQTRFG